jgi:glycosyltransferase involved in cell wall biosynthesis
VQMKWCVVIPTFNNDRTLEDVLHDVSRVTGSIIVVNDGSTDRTADILKRFPDIAVISYPINKGKGYALRKGFEKAAAEGFQYAVTMDSDGQHFSKDIPEIIKMSSNYPDALIVGSRTLPQEKLRQGSGFANKFSNFWFRFISGVSLPDTQSGFRIYPLDKIKSMRFFSNKYEFELEVLIRSAWRGIPLKSIPISVYYPEKSERVSHFRPFRDFFRISVLNTVCVLVALLYVKPFAFIQYFKKENIRSFLKENVLHSRESIRKLTFSVMLGVFMGIVPIWGYQLITAIALAYVFKLNKLIVIVAANISIPPMIPFIIYFSYLTGGIVLSSNQSMHFTTEFSFSLVRDNLFQYVIGAICLAVLAAAFFGMLTFIFLKVIRRKPAII